MKKIKYNNIKRNDIIKTIYNDGILYTPIVHDYPEHKFKNELKPINVDNDGLITVRIKGQLYNIDLEDVEEVQYNESKFLKDYELFLENKNHIIKKQIPLPKDIQEIAQEYIKNGKDIFVVGGAVRDFLQGKKPKDYDLVTNALPDESKNILKDFNVSDEQGKSFGVLRVYTKDEPEGHEIASYRKDISKGRDTKGDEQKVKLGKGITMEDDASRRDLTINAMYYDIKNKQIIDLYGGYQDLKNKVVKSVGEPEKRFDEDRLRICRIFRFAARIGGNVSSKVIETLKKDSRLKNIGDKDDVSQERIIEEIQKAFKQSKNFNYYLSFYDKFNMWNEVFPNAKINKKRVQSDYLLIHLSNLFLPNSIKFLKFNLVENYKFDSDTAKQILFLLGLIDLPNMDIYEFDKLYKQKKNSKLSNQIILEWVKKQKLDKLLYNKFLNYKPVANSKQLMDKGYKGKELGDKIKEINYNYFFKNK